MAAKKKGGAKRGASKKKAQAKVGKVMHEFKHGQLKSGGRRKVTNPKQAIAIGLSEARRAGADVPPRKSAAKKKGGAKRKGTAAKKGAAKKGAAKKGATKKKSSRGRRS
jgi:Family of unknown function (DUF6496)